MSTPDTRQLAALIVAYQAAAAAARAALVAYVGRLWRSFGSYHDAELAQFLQRLLPVLQGAEQHMADLTAAYLTQYRQATLGVVEPAFTVRSADVTGAATRNGTDPATVYRRPFEQVWTDWSKGVDPQTAVDRGLTRAESLVATDLQRTKALTSQEAMGQDHRVVGYRRVLEGTYSCGLCVIASTQRYHKSELLPIHPRCDCGVSPIYGGRDPGLVIDKGLLKDVHAVVAETFGPDAARSDAKGYHDLIVTHEHGELGPVLARRSDHWQGPTERPGHTSRHDFERTVPYSEKDVPTEQLRSTLAALERSQAKFPLPFNERRIEELRRELASR